MTSITPAKWNLSRETFERLLRALSADLETASREYETLRRRLIHFFDWRGAASPDVLADETLDRLARKIESGEAIDNVLGYARGIARYVLQEAQRRTSREQRALEHAGRIATAVEDDTVDLWCLEKCLGELPTESRRLIVAYYEGDGKVHLPERRALADRLGITYGALNKRAFRLRNELEECVTRCVGGAPRKG